jgi:RNA polymerase sigma factor (sigma-70 family)
MNEPLDSTAEDAELLRRYAADGSEAAFAELVRRRIGLVYSVALRQTRGDRHRAEDATQAVFSDLARKARALAERPVLAGWLYRSAQFAAAGLMRAESRRLAREQEAHLMEKDSAPDAPAVDWEKVRPVLDEALNEIDERDRDAIVLRFFDGRPFAEIGAQLRTSENAARMRVERALDKLQSALARRGVTSTTAALGLALGSQVAMAAPTGLAATVTGAALAGGTATATTAAAFIMGMTKLQVAAVAVLAAAGGLTYVSQAETNAALQREVAATRVEPQAMTTLRAENQRLVAAANEVEMLRGNDAELAQLERAVVEARQVQKAKAERVRQSQLGGVEERVKRLDMAAQQEVDRMNKEGNLLVVTFKALNERAKDPTATPEARAQAKAEADAKIAEIQAKQKEIQEFIKASREYLTQSSVNARNGLPPPEAPEKVKHLESIQIVERKVGTPEYVPGEISISSGRLEMKKTGTP